MTGTSTCKIKWGLLRVMVLIWLTISTTVFSSVNLLTLRENLDSDMGSNLMRSSLYTFRLKPGEDLKRGISNFVSEQNLRAVSILTCVGSLRQINIRLATSRNGTMRYFFRDRETFEIVSLVGTFETYEGKPTYGHVHISAADSNGTLVGGHLMKGSIVFTTAEITLIENHEIQFDRRWDRQTGFNELVVEKRSPANSVVPRGDILQKDGNSDKSTPNWKGRLLAGLSNVLNTLDISDSKDDLEHIL